MNFHHINTIFKKEFTDLFRDKKDHYRHSDRSSSAVSAAYAHYGRRPRFYDERRL